jgi:hypothetical protein
MTFYSSDQDFATELLRSSNQVERCQFSLRSLGRYNNKEAQLAQMHRALHHRSHQAEY